MSLRKIALFATIVVLPVIAALTLSGSPPASAATDAGTIAYFRRSTDEVRLIQPDGTNDRLLWTAPTANSLLGVVNLEWRPDGGALAFSSDQEDALLGVRQRCLHHTEQWLRAAAGDELPGLRRARRLPEGHGDGDACLTSGSWSASTSRVPLGPHADPGVRDGNVHRRRRPRPGCASVHRRRSGASTAAWLPRWTSRPARRSTRACRTRPLRIPDYGTGDLSWRSDGSQIGYAMRNGADVYQISANPPLRRHRPDAADGGRHAAVSRGLGTGEQTRPVPLLRGLRLEWTPRAST